MRKSLQERFDEKYEPVTESGCWIWLSGCDINGYGRIWHSTAPAYAHRISYELHIGKIPKGIYVLHKCDTPSCVNPDHLFLGTNQDNMDDMSKKGRANHVYSEDIVNEIRNRWPNYKGTQADLAKEYTMSRGAMYKIINNITWKHI